tara:strand:+ start:1415 stop:1597 length:183 start_codon:yes stop_codon:yes gene_type:complete
MRKDKKLPKLNRGITKDMSEDEKKDKLVKNFLEDIEPHKEQINKMPRKLFLHILGGGRIQ